MNHPASDIISGWPFLSCGPYPGYFQKDYKTRCCLKPPAWYSNKLTCIQATCQSHSSSSKLQWDLRPHLSQAVTLNDPPSQQTLQLLHGTSWHLNSAVRSRWPSTQKEASDVASPWDSRGTCEGRLPKSGNQTRIDKIMRPLISPQTTIYQEQ